MTSKKTHDESELDKQYNEYRAQFEQWKEKNKNSIGTDAYNDYVKQFENWEKDVEKRRKVFREKAIREALEAKIQAEEEERERRAMAAKEAEAAEAYAQSQQAYMAHHQAAMEAEKRQQELSWRCRAKQGTANEPGEGAARAAPSTGTTMFSQPPPTHGHPMIQDKTSDVVLREMMNVLGSTNATISAAPVMQQPAQAQQQTAPPQLWGNIKLGYDRTDPLCTRWGHRAAPPHITQPSKPPMVPTPCWMLMEELREKKKILAPHIGLPPPAFMPGVPPPVMNGNGTH